MRRAALMNTDDEAEESGSGDESDDEDARSEEADPFEDIDALSDEEAKEELRQAQQLKMLEDSQVNPSPNNSFLSRPMLLP